MRVFVATFQLLWLIESSSILDVPPQAMILIPITPLKPNDTLLDLILVGEDDEDAKDYNSNEFLRFKLLSSRIFEYDRSLPNVRPKGKSSVALCCSNSNYHV